MHLQTCLLTIAAMGSTFALTQGLEVGSSIGQISGFVDPSLPYVKQWLGIPFAEPPIGPLRFLPPVAISEGQRNISAQKAPASCPQYNSFPVFSNEVPEFLAPPPYDEDCLYLNVISPKDSRSRDLPVLFWVYGGATLQGGINTPYERPQQWVQRTQEHIVVQTNYRLNIFGSPNAKGLDQQNVGILDTRLALEWVRKNIQSFGGNPNSITAWGQSGGASIIDALQFAYPSDPIFQAVILESAVILQARPTTDPGKTSFSYVARQLGCPANSSATDEVEFMRSIDAGVIENFLQTHSQSNATPSLYFQPSADGKVIFTPQEYLSKGKAGEYADVPAILGTNTDEGSLLVPFSQQGPPRATIEAATLAGVLCPVVETTRYRAATGRPTYRYLYGGNFTNISPLPWLGAYHGAEIPLITGTYGNFRGEGTPFERSVSEKMQDLWLAFARDPQHGLQKSGWSAVSGGVRNVSGNAVVFARDEKVVQMEHISVIDANCPAS